MMTRYGVRHAAQNETIKEKTRKTNLKRYGCKYSFQSPEVREKGKRTCLKKYGVEHGMQNNEIKEKARRTCLKKYGCENPSQSEIIKERIQKSNLEKYGCRWFVQSDEFQKKYEETCLDKFGTSNAAKAEVVKEKEKKTKLERYGDENYSNREKAKESYKKKTGYENPAQNPDVHRKAFSYRRKNNEGYLSKPEKKFADILWVNGLAFESEFFRNGHNFDFKVGDVLIEIDGEYAHGILSDSDGKHVNLAKDHLRFKQAEPFKLLVIDSSRLNAGFKELIRILPMTYEDYENDMISNLPQEFPYPIYSEKMIRDGLRKLEIYTYHKGQNFGRAYQRTIHKELFEPYAKAWASKKGEWVKERKVYWSPVSSKQIADAFEIDVPNMSEEKFRSLNKVDE